MPLLGRFYTSQELQSLLGVSKQRIVQIAAAQSWASPEPGLYYAESVEPWLMHSRNIDPATLKVISWHCPEGQSNIEFLRQQTLLKPG